MSTYNKPPFKQFIKTTLKKALEAESLIKSLQIVSEAMASNYPDTKIWFAEKFGKRQSFIAGSEKEQYIPPEKIQLTEKYSVFLQNFPDIANVEKDIWFFSILVGLNVMQTQSGQLLNHYSFLLCSVKGKGCAPGTQLTFECRALDRTHPKAF